MRFEDFLQGLGRTPWRRRPAKPIPRPPPLAEFRPARDRRPITITRLFQRLNAFLSDATVVVADVGDALFGAADLLIHQRTDFLGAAYYASMGFGVPAGIGAQLANRRRRPLILVGDGAFQMTGMELATAVRYRLNPIVVVLNNHGYGTERQIHDGPYNDVAVWHYHQVPAILGAGRSFVVATEGDLQRALAAAQQCTQCYCLLEVMLDPRDRSPALQRLGQRLGKKI